MITAEVHVLYMLRHVLLLTIDTRLRALKGKQYAAKFRN